MRILHVITNMDPKMGGVSQAVQTMVDGLNKIGDDSEVVSLNDPREKFIQDISLTVHALGLPKGPWAYSAKLVPWLTENLGRFDCVIIHGLWQYHSYSVEKTFRKFLSSSHTVVNNVRTKLYVMPHGMLDPYFQRAAGRRLKAIRNLIYWQLIERHVINRADGLLFTCEDERLLAREPFKPYHPKQELVVGLGVEDPPPFESRMREAFIRKCPELNGQRYILFLSRIHEKKGVHNLIRAYAELAEAQTDTKFTFPKLVIAGPGLESAYGHQILQLCAEREFLKDLIFFPGMLIKEAKWGAFYGCEAFILPSHQENFGIATVEALACAKPVLITRQINIWREISEAAAGFIDTDTLDGTRRLITQWLALAPAEKSIMETNARRLFEKKFTVDMAASKLHHVLTLAQSHAQ